MQIKEVIKKINYKSDNFNIITLNSGARIKYLNKLPSLMVGDFILAEGEFIDDGKYGRTFLAKALKKEEKEVNLLSIAIDGIGDKKSKEIIDDCKSYKVFFEEPFKIFDYFLSTTSKSILEQIREKRERFTNNDKEIAAKEIAKEIKGVGKKKLLEWFNDFESWHKFDVQCFLEDINIIKYLASSSALEIYVQILRLKELEKVYFSLNKWKINDFVIRQLFKDYKKQDILKIISNDPYILLDYNVTFPVADNIAINEYGKDTTSYVRIINGLKYIIKQHESEGSTFAYFDDAKNETIEFLKISEEIFDSSLDKELRLGYDSNFIKEDDRIYRRVIFFTEKKLGKMLSDKIKLPGNIIPVEITNYLAKTKLSDEQKNAVVGVLSKKISILTGGPGTGKTTTINEVCNCLDKMNKKYLLCAPTGRAAKRMQESTMREAKTIHRLLEYKMMGNVGYFAKNERYQLFADYIIVDESSMIDVYLFNSLLKATKTNTSLIFVGDIDQLPSVSMGSILIDMKDSKKIPVFELTEVFRQSKESTIVRNAYHIKNNEPLEVAEDFKFKNITSYEDVKKYFENNPLTQILCPMRVGDIGTKKINELIQSIKKYKNSKNIYHNGFIYKEDDKVIQISNDYNKNVYNGEIGIIKEINNDGLIVYYPNNEVSEISYNFNELYKIEPAYAVTIHKSQGSETDNLVVIIDGNEEFLSKELIYTAVTRAKKNITILSTKNIEFFKDLKSSSKRLTNLSNLIK